MIGGGGAEFSSTGGGLGIGSIVGAWLTGRTVTVKSWVMLLTPPLAVPPSSVTVTAMTALPICSGARV